MAPTTTPTKTTAEIVSADRIHWSSLRVATIREVAREAAAHGDLVLVRKAHRALDARCVAR